MWLRSFVDPLFEPLAGALGLVVLQSFERLYFYLDRAVVALDGAADPDDVVEFDCRIRADVGPPVCLIWTTTPSMCALAPVSRSAMVDRSGVWSMSTVR